MMTSRYLSEFESTKHYKLSGSVKAKVTTKWRIKTGGVLRCYCLSVRDNHRLSPRTIDQAVTGQLFSYESRRFNVESLHFVGSLGKGKYPSDYILSKHLVQILKRKGLQGHYILSDCRLSTKTRCTNYILSAP